ncbi:hypothetical protein GL213_02740 [Halogeometricum borinquense]|uniref:Uncharacterized protein n=1 Tax=Halogeometricum borinquense TaxID=60847 RepID=A0A6C0UK29_9EURY|nr:hypothetical protein [Halogeometricum borinquense]QIB75874.1 hypothetical protein G3I44_17270 [Halogeometricum borinquense]QIQ75543.1 hypothetical protein GL213_02740 [Halogeometricum borinquense]
MDDSLVVRVWGDVTERVGDDLRAVTQYEATSFATRMREDLRDVYDADDNQTIVDDTIVTLLSGRDSERTLETGEFRAFVRVFDDAWILTWVDGLPKKSGFLISIERDGETATMNDVEWCIQYLDEEIEPLIE